MPEGDTAHRIAKVLGRELTGLTLTHLALHDLGEQPELVGQTITKVSALGKHVLIGIGDDWTLRVHLGMHGGWARRHVKERRPEKWVVVLAVGNIAYICERAYRAELIRTKALGTHPALARLGPDLLADPPDIAKAVARAQLPAHADREIGDVLLDQRVAAGIGNIYKSETLFECRVHPRTLVRELSAERLTNIYETAARLMRLELLTRGKRAAPVRRRDTPTKTRFWVYMRHGKPCYDCKTPIERFLQGDNARSTYFCPHCQPG